MFLTNSPMTPIKWESGIFKVKFKLLYLKILETKLHLNCTLHASNIKLQNNYKVIANYKIIAI